MIPAEKIEKITFKNIIMTIGNLPSSYVESLSYYECMLWLCDYLEKTVIPALNNNGEAVEELQGLYAELKTYVDSYFDNLDVQTEINNKLDQMVEDGTLQELFNNLASDLYDNIDEIQNNMLNTLTQLNNKVNSIQSYNTNPIPVNSTSSMVDTTKIYILTTDGNWYYHNGEDWVSGGSYQSSTYGRNVILNENIGGKITDDKRLLANNLVSLAEEIKDNTRLTGYSSITYLPGYATDNNCTTMIFDIDTLLTYSQYFGFSLPYSTATQVMIYYTAGEKAVNASRDGATTNNQENYYDSSANMYYRNIRTNYEKVAICFPKFNELLFIPNTKSKYLTDIESIINMNVNNKYKDFNIVNTNILNFADEIKLNTRLSGYNTSTYLPSTQPEPTSFVAYFTSANIPSQLYSQIYYQVNQQTQNSNVMIWYNPGRNAVNAAKTDIYASANYNSDTNYFKLDSNRFTNYEKVAISFYIHDNVLSLYSDLWNEGNPNYRTINIVDPAEEIILPSNVYVVNNNSNSIYYNNILKYGNANKYQKVQITGQFTINTPECSIYTPNETGTKQARVSIYKNNTKDLYLSKYFNYVVVPETAGSGQTKNVLIIGDSLTDQNVYLQTINTLFSSDVMNINFIGTLDQRPYFNEGRSGWRSYTYCNCQYGSQESTSPGFYQGLNPFYNPTSHEFDFSYYMQENNFSNIDYVFINLGTNDVARDDHSTESDIISYYNEIIDSIHTYNSNIKIALWLPPTRGTLNNITGREINDTFVFKMHKYLIDNFDNNQIANVYVYNSNLMLNPNEDYNTKTVTVAGETFTTVDDLIHPASSGYVKIGYATYYMIKYLASL